MLIHCPRCGFSQPQDQYCAQCGVDMQAYRPKEEPLFVRLARNTTLQICVLLAAALVAGHSILRSERPQSWVQRITHFQGISKSPGSKSSGSSTGSAEKSETEAGLAETYPAANTAGAAPELEALRSQPLNIPKNGETLPGGGSAATGGAAGGAQDLSSVNFKLSYAEISHEALNKWVTESSNLGLYQSFSDYSAGIIYDFKKFSAAMPPALKTADIRLPPGGTNSNISGAITDDGTQVVGLVTTVEYKSGEGDAIHGNISVTRNKLQGSESYPAEFGLPRGSAFFIIGVLKPDTFGLEQPKLNMPPFQILKSPGFMSRKTEFVIILEPDYK